MYRPAAITQRDGSEHASSNCRFAAAATGIDFHTLGSIESDGADMRDRSGDPSGGSTSDDAERSWSSYDQDLRVRDGLTWADAEDDLRDGRLVHIDVWHAAVGGPCLSGSGGYGHTMAIAPERDGSRWLVSDPWCNPPKWKWTEAAKLRAGAEEWADRCGWRSAQSGGPRDVRQLTRHALLRIVRELMGRWYPGHELDPGDDDYQPGTGGGAPVLFTTSRVQGASDMSIQAPASLESEYTLTVPEGTSFYADGDLREKLGTLGSERTYPYVGLVNGAESRAVVIVTSKPYGDDDDKPTVCYVPKGAGDPVHHPPAEPPDPGDPGGRDQLWRSWLESDPHAPDAP
jgi:hypothetical protein